MGAEMGEVGQSIRHALEQLDLIRGYLDLILPGL
jgi:hypothetical protein